MSDASPINLEAEIAKLQEENARLRRQLQGNEDAAGDLRIALARRQSLLANTPLAVITWDTDFRVLDWNPSAERIFGFTAEQAIGQHGCDLLVPVEAREQVEQVFRDLLLQRGGWQSSNENVTGTGNKITCSWNNATILDDHGEVVGVISHAQDVTQQQETAQALSRSEGMLRSIVEFAPNLVVLIDRQSCITYINRVEPGMTRAQVVGQVVYDFVLPEDRPIVEGAIQRVFATGQPEEYEVREFRQGRWYHTNLAPVLDGDEITHVVAICVDVHQRHQQEQALAESENRLRLATGQLPAVSWTTDRELRFTSSTGAGLEAMGLEQNQVVGMSLQEFFQTEDRDFLPLNAAYRAADGESVSYEHSHGDRWYRVHVEPLHNADGQMIGTVGIALDFTDQKLAELKHEKSQRTFEILARNVPGTVYVCQNDDRYTMLFLNDEVEHLLGIPASEFTDDKVSFVELFHPEDASTIPTLVDAAVAQHAPFHLRYRLRHANGDWIWVEEHGQGVYDDEGELRYLVGGVFDITTQRSAEEALLRSKEELESLVNLRTQELRTANRLLREDYKQQLALTQKIRLSEETLQSQMRMLRRMLYVHDRDRQLIAYEIHDGMVQYMTGVNLYLQAATSKIDSDPQGAKRDLEKSTSILADTINEAHRLIDGLRPGVLEEQGVVAAVQYLCEQTEQRSDITTQFSSDVQFERLAPAVEMAIYRIVQEGLNNIVKHSQSPRAKVVLSQRTDSLVVKIEDWGQGFDPRRVESKRYGLTGIRDRARLLGGKAKVRTELGQGTLLRVKLPLEDIILPQAWQQPEVDSAGEGSSADWRLPPQAE